MFDNLQNTQLGAGAGMLIFMLGKDALPWWKRVIFCVLGFIGSSLTTQALVDYFHFSAAMSGGIGFFIAVIIIPVANSLINFAENPSKLVKFVQAIMGKKGDDNA